MGLRRERERDHALRRANGLAENLVPSFRVLDGTVQAGKLPVLSRLRLLRLSITDRCNFRCRYCMPVEGVPKADHSEILSLETLAELVGWLGLRTGIDRVRLTGGEPLVRRGIESLIANLSAIPEIHEVCLTTNGSLLPGMAQSLKKAGLSRVNVSLDSLDKERFTAISRGGSLQRTLAGIEAAQAAGLTPIKLNTVLHRSTWRDDVPRLLDYAADTGFEIRFIELMRTGTERAWCESEFISVDEVRSELGAEVIQLAENNVTPARRTQMNWRGMNLTVGWISPRSHRFCDTCERLRMDARGRIRRCLMDANTLDLHHLLETADAREAWADFAGYLAGKVPPVAMDSALAMSQIGG